MRLKMLKRTTLRGTAESDAISLWVHHFKRLLSHYMRYFFHCWYTNIDLCSLEVQPKLSITIRSLQPICKMFIISCFRGSFSVPLCKCCVSGFSILPKIQRKRVSWWNYGHENFNMKILNIKKTKSISKILLKAIIIHFQLMRPSSSSLHAFKSQVRISFVYLPMTSTAKWSIIFHDTVHPASQDQPMCFLDEWNYGNY